MRQLTWKLVLPLTIISFAVWSKWWVVHQLPDRELTVSMVGFPFPYAADALYTSLALEIFILELTADLLVYFLFWYLIVFLINRFAFRVQLKKIVVIPLLAVGSFFVLFLILMASNPEHIYHVTNPYEIKVVDSGYEFLDKK